MDRSATCLFGIRNYGVDINGYVRHPTRGLCIWLQQRSDTKQTWPGKWDNMVGGGLSVGYGIEETAVKEAFEEASIPEALIKVRKFLKYKMEKRTSKLNIELESISHARTH